MAAAEPVNPQLAQDERLRWIQKRVCTTFDLDQKSRPLQESADAGAIAVSDFFKYEDCRRLFAWKVAHNAVTACLAPPISPVGKILSFRKRPGVLVVHEISEEVLVAECDDEAWEQLWTLSHDLYMPVALAEKGLCEKSSNDAAKLYHDFQKLHASMQVTRGAVLGEFVLPDPPQTIEEYTRQYHNAYRHGYRTSHASSGNISPIRPSPQNSDERTVVDRDNVNVTLRNPSPPKAPRMSPARRVAGSRAGVRCGGVVSDRDRERERIHLLETTVVGWVRMVKALLKRDGLQEHVGGDIPIHPGPLVELMQRAAAAATLSSVLGQLHGQPIAEASNMLHTANSSYATVLDQLTRDVEQHASDADNTLMYANTLRPWFEQLSNENATIDQLRAVMGPTLATLRLVQLHCPFYHASRRLHAVLRMLANEVVRQCSRAVHNANFASSPHALLAKTRAVLGVCAEFRGQYADARLKQKQSASAFPDGDGIPDGAPPSAGTRRHATVTISTTPPRKPKRLPWQWPQRGDSCFQRLDKFVDRCNEVADIAECVVQFQTLPTVVLAGPRAHALVAQLTHVTEDTNAVLRHLYAQDCDYFDVDAKADTFETLYFRFKLDISRIERTLVDIFAAMYDDDMTLPQHCCIVESLGVLAQRDTIVAGLTHRFHEGIDLIHTELQHVQHLFDTRTGHDAVEIFANDAISTPPLAGAYTWGRMLLARANLTQTQLQKIPSAARNAVFDAARTLYIDLQQKIEAYCTEVAAQWEVLASSATESMLAVPLLVFVNGRDDASFGDTLPAVRVNFDATLVRLLHEADKFDHHNVAVPNPLRLVRQQAQALHETRVLLADTIAAYDELRVRLSATERALFREQYAVLGSTLQRGVTDLTWVSHNVQDYAQAAYNRIVLGLAHRIAVVRDNNRAIDTLLQSVLHSSYRAGVLSRAAGAPLELDALVHEHATRTEHFTRNLCATSTKLQHLVEGIFDAGFVSKKAPGWQDFVADLESCIAHGITNVIRSCLADVLSAVAPSSHPFLLLVVDLHATHVVSKPPLTTASFQQGVPEYLHDWCQTIAAYGKHVCRLSVAEGTFEHCRLDPQVQATIATIMEQVHTTCEQSNAILHSLSAFDFVVRNDVEEQFALFLDTNELPVELVAPDADAAGRSSAGRSRHASEAHPSALFGRMHDLAALGATPDPACPTIEDFDAFLGVFRRAQVQLRETPATRTVHWITVDITRARSVLLSWACKWVYKFGAVALQRLVESIRIINTYFNETNAGIATLLSSVDGNDADDAADGVVVADDAGATHAGSDGAFVQTMKFFHDVTATYEDILTKIGPIQRTTVFLARYDLHLERSDMHISSEIKDKMASVKVQLAFARKHLAPRMAQQAHRIESKLQGFRITLSQRLAEFYESGIFDASCQHHRAAVLLVQFTRMLQELAESAREVQHLQELTGASLATFPDLEQAKLDINGLDEVLNVKAHSHEVLAVWLEQPWMDVDLDAFAAVVAETLNAASSLRPIAHPWAVTQDVFGFLRGLQAAAPLMRVLNTRAMRARHWKQFLRVVGHELDMPSASVKDFTVREFIALAPHDYAADVGAIVQQATVDADSEASLKAYDEKWLSARFQFVPFVMAEADIGDESDNTLPERDDDAAGVLMLDAFDGVYDMVNDHQLHLETLLQSKSSSILVFSREILATQARLRCVEAVLDVLSRVQHRWQQLVPMFGTGALPQHPTVFARLSSPTDGACAELRTEQSIFRAADATYLALIAAVKRDPLVTRACCEPGRLQLLKTVDSDLELCANGFAVWLGPQRSKFPAFFFTSPHTALAAIAACSQPHNLNSIIATVLPAVGKLDIYELEHGRFYARGMHARHHEVLEFSPPVPLHGPFDVVLAALTDSTRHTLRIQLAKLLEEHAESGILSPVDPSAHAAPAGTAVTPAGTAGGAAYSMGWVAGDRLLEPIILAIALAIDQETTTALQRGAALALQVLLDARITQLNSLVQLLRRVVSEYDHVKFSILITFLLHARDVTARLLEEHAGLSSYTWQAQLRHVWHPDEGNLEICTYGCTLQYGFEYFERSHGILLTPLTERCFTHVMQAVAVQTGGALVSTHAAGKTDTLRALAHAVGKHPRMLSCHTDTSHVLLQDWLAGMAATGAWVVLDDVQHLPAATLSMLATTLRSVYTALWTQAQHVAVGTQSVALQQPLACAMTFRCRTLAGPRLPSAIARFFRATTMVVPSLGPITELMLLSHGFTDPMQQAKKLTALFAACAKLLGGASFDWGLRTIRAVIRFVTIRKLAAVHSMVLDDATCLRNAVKEYILARLSLRTHTDQFHSLFEHVFGDAGARQELEDADGVYIEHVQAASRQLGYVPTEEFCDDVEALGELLCIRRTVIIVGDAGTGKSARWKTLARARNNVGKCVTTVQVAFPEALGDNFFGSYQSTTGDNSLEWRDGLVPRLLRRDSEKNAANLAPQHTAATQVSPGGRSSVATEAVVRHAWYVFDGTLNATQASVFLSAMEDGDLQLGNGDVVQIPETTFFLCECDGLDHVSPSMLARSALLHVSSPNVRQNALLILQHWSIKYDDVAAAVWECGSAYIRSLTPAIVRRFQPVFAGGFSLVGVVHTAIALFDAMSDNARDTIPDAGTLRTLIPLWMNYAMLWAFGGMLSADACDAPIRTEFSTWWRSAWPQVEFHGDADVWSYRVDTAGCRLVQWTNPPPGNLVPPPNALCAAPAVENATVRALAHVLHLLIRKGRSVMLAGGGGGGKSTFLTEQLRHLCDTEMAEWQSIKVQGNMLLTPEHLWREVEHTLECNSARTYFPRGNTKGVLCFIDDINMACANQTNTVEYLRQHMDYGMVYQTDTMASKLVHGVSFLLGADTNSGQASVGQRMQRHVCVLNFAPFGANTIEAVYLEMAGLGRAPSVGAVEEVDHGTGVRWSSPWDTMGGGTADTMTRLVVGATMDLHQRVLELYTTAVERGHYAFGKCDLDLLMDNFRVCGAFRQSNGSRAVHLWAVECHSIYGLRLSSDTDAARFWQALCTSVHNFFGPELSYQLEAGMVPLYALVDDASVSLQRLIDEPRIVVSEAELHQQREAVRTLAVDCCKRQPILSVHAHENLMAPLSHLLRVLRTCPKKASLLLLGPSAMDLTLLAAYIAHYAVEHAGELTTVAFRDFQDRFSDLAMRAGTTEENIVYVMDAMHCRVDVLSVINDFVCSGDITALLSPDHFVAINTLLQPRLLAENVPVSRTNAIRMFLRQAQRNLRIVLHLPVDDQSETRVISLRHEFPKLFENVDVMWVIPRQLHDPASLDRTVQSVMEHMDTPWRAILNDSAQSNFSRLLANLHASVGEATPATRTEINTHRFLTSPATLVQFVHLAVTLVCAYRRHVDNQLSRLQDGLARIDVVSADVSRIQASLAKESQVLAEKQQISTTVLTQLGREGMCLARKQATLGEYDATEKSLAEKLPVLERTLDRHQSEATKLKQAMTAARKKLTKDTVMMLQSVQATTAVEAIFAALIVVLKFKTKSVDDLDLTWRTGVSRLIVTPGELQMMVDQVQNASYIPKQLAVVHEHLSVAAAANDRASVPASVQALEHWVTAVHALHRHRADVVVPAGNTCHATKASHARVVHERTQAHQQCRQLEARIQLLKASYEKSVRIKNDQKTRVRVVSTEMSAAEAFLHALSTEQAGWNTNVSVLQAKVRAAFSRCVIAAAMQTYLGPFTEQFRRDLLYKAWLPILRERGMPVGGSDDTTDEDFTFGDVLPLVASEAMCLHWDRNGTTEYVRVNDSILCTSPQWPLLIDPQALAVRAITDLETKHRLVVFDLHGGSTDIAEYEHDIMLACKEQRPVLVVNVGAALSPHLKDVIVASHRAAREVSTAPNSPTQAPIAFDNMHYRRDGRSAFRLYLVTQDVDVVIPAELAAFLTLVSYEDIHVAELQVRLQRAMADAPHAAAADHPASRGHPEKHRAECQQQVATDMRQIADCDAAIMQLLQGQNRTAIAEQIECKHTLVARLGQSRRALAMVQWPTPAAAQVAGLAARVFTILARLSTVHPAYGVDLGAFTAVVLQGMDATGVGASLGVRGGGGGGDDGGGDGSPTPPVVSHALRGGLVQHVLAWACPTLLREHRVLVRVLVASSALLVDLSPKATSGGPAADPETLRHPHVLSPTEFNVLLDVAAAHAREAHAGAWGTEEHRLNLGRLAEALAWRRPTHALADVVLTGVHSAQWKAWVWDAPAVVVAGGPMPEDYACAHPLHPAVLAALVVAAVRPTQLVSVLQQCIARVVGVNVATDTAESAVRQLVHVTQSIPPLYQQALEHKFAARKHSLHPVVVCQHTDGVTMQGADVIEAAAVAAGLDCTHALKRIAVYDTHVTQWYAVVREAFLRGQWLVFENIHLIPALVPTLCAMLYHAFDDVASGAEAIESPHGPPLRRARVFFTMALSTVLPQYVRTSAYRFVTQHPGDFQSAVADIHAALADDASSSSLQNPATNDVVQSVVAVHTLLMVRGRHCVPIDTSLACEHVCHALRAAAHAQTFAVTRADGASAWHGAVADMYDDVYGTHGSHGRHVAQWGLDTYLTPDTGRKQLHTFVAQTHVPSDTDATAILALPPSRMRVAAEQTLHALRHVAARVLTTSTLPLPAGNGGSPFVPEAVRGMHATADSTSANYYVHGTMMLNLLSSAGNFVEGLLRDVPAACLSGETSSTHATPVQRVLRAECERVDGILTTVRVDLEAILHCGVINATFVRLYPVYRVLREGRVPRRWDAHAAESGTPLGRWIQRLQRMHSQLHPLVIGSGDAIPTELWLGGILQPAALVQAFLETVAAAKQWSLCDAVCVVTPLQAAREAPTSPPTPPSVLPRVLAEAPTPTLTLTGLILENAHWNRTSGGMCCAADCAEETTTSLPPLQLTVHASQATREQDTAKTNAAFLQCPLYHNALATEVVLDVTLPVASSSTTSETTASTDDAQRKRLLLAGARVHIL